MTQADQARASAEPDRGVILRRIFTVSQTLVVAVFVAFIIGSLVFTGGRVFQTQDLNWPEAWAWPVFPVPWWLVVVPAVVAAVVVIPMTLRTPARRAGRLLGALGQTLGAGAAAVAFMYIFPAETGVLPQPVVDGYLGLHGLALPLQAVCVAVLIVGVAVRARSYEKLRRAGEDVS